jgi:phosphoserine phosphatase
MLTSTHWQLETPVNAVIFDCDGTLSSIEGIDELARVNNIGVQVQALTNEAMSHTGLNPDLYRQRLLLTKPTQKQVIELGQTYFKHQSTDVHAVVQILKRLNKSIYMISAGVNPAVSLFGQQLGIPQTHIFAVNLEFDATGNYQAFDESSPLVNNNGKREIVAHLHAKHQYTGYTGDGMNDFVVRDIVTRFIGYGGTFYRENLAKQCDYYIINMSALLPLLLTASEYDRLNADEQALFDKGIAALQGL